MLRVMLFVVMCNVKPTPVTLIVFFIMMYVHRINIEVHCVMGEVMLVYCVMVEQLY